MISCGLNQNVNIVKIAKAGKPFRILLFLFIDRHPEKLTFKWIKHIVAIFTGSPVTSV